MHRSRSWYCMGLGAPSSTGYPEGAAQLARHSVGTVAGRVPKARTRWNVVEAAADPAGGAAVLYSRDEVVEGGVEADLAEGGGGGAAGEDVSIVPRQTRHLSNTTAMKKSKTRREVYEARNREQEIAWGIPDYHGVLGGRPLDSSARRNKQKETTSGEAGMGVKYVGVPLSNRCLALLPNLQVLRSVMY